MSQEIKDLIAKLRGEVEKKYESGLRAIAELESQLLGGKEASAADPTPNKAAAPAASIPAATTDSTNVGKVLTAIRDTYKTVAQICQETGLNEGSVKAVIYSKYLKVAFDKKRVGKEMSYKAGKPKTAKIEKSSRPDGQPSVRSQVLEVVKQAGANGIRRSEVDAALKDVNQKTIGTALFSLKNNGHVQLNAETGVYRIKA